MSGLANINKGVSPVFSPFNTFLGDYDIWKGDTYLAMFSLELAKKDSLKYDIPGLSKA